MSKLGILPTMYYGNYNVEKIPCGFHDERHEECGVLGYSTIYLRDEGYTLIACQEHWDKYWRNKQ